MSEDRLNYGIPEDYGPRPASYPRATLDSASERTWSVLAHLSIFLNVFSGGFLGPVAAGAIWLVYRDRSARVAFHALQSLWYQLAWLVIVTVGWTVAGILTAVLIGFLLFPVMLLLTLVPFVHAAYAAYKVGQGTDYRYLQLFESSEPTL
jgi:uncharacterized Tic20 family protein